MDGQLANEMKLNNVASTITIVMSGD